MGQWVLREASRQARAWLDEGLRAIPVGINISSVESQSDGFLEGIRTILKDTRLEPCYLELEMTERVLMQHAESISSVLKALKVMGVQLAVDDFGTGYSSLSLFNTISDRCPEARPIVRARDHRRYRGRRNRQRSDQYGQKPQAASHRGGRGNSSAALGSPPARSALSRPSARATTWASFFSIAVVVVHPAWLQAVRIWLQPHLLKASTSLFNNITICGLLTSRIPSAE